MTDTAATDDRVFCRNCGRAIFRIGGRGWLHVSSHESACPSSFAQPEDEVEVSAQ